MGEVTERTLMKKGAEASLFLAEWHGKRVVVKARLPKTYRPAQLDLSIRNHRTVREPQLMHEAKKAGVPTPTIFMVDVKNSAITMEYIEGKQIKTLLDGLPNRERHALSVKIGELIGRLHAHGIVHGDLTTSNMILTAEDRIFLVDFGLGDRTSETEARGVDLHLMRQALQSTHFQCAEECFNAVLEGYAAVLGAETAEKVLDKIKEIQKRGRYVAERRQTA